MARRFPKTQKAQGVLALKHLDQFALKGPGSPLMVIPGALSDCRLHKIKWPMFARPCPFTPRHGFIDSRLVGGWGEVIELLQLSTEADLGKPVEIILAPPLTGVVSAVATNAGVTWGYGNDGVTAGTDKSPLFIPVKSASALWKEAVIGLVDYMSHFEVPDFPYLEIVEHHERMCVVQIRSGPEQSGGDNHIVRKTKVRRILRADHTIDLLTWEALVREGASKPGTVISAYGMSLSSHFCVHGIENGLPVVTKLSVQIGDVLLPTKDKATTLTKREYTKLAFQIEELLNASSHLITYRAQRAAVMTAIATIQAQFCWGKQPHLLRLRSHAVVLLLKAALASCCGEIRHWGSECGPRKIDEPTVTMHFAAHFHLARQGRAMIYDTVLNNPRSLSTITNMLKAAKKDLNVSGWNRSFGGRPWVSIAKVGGTLAKRLDMFLKNPCSANWSQIIQVTNRLINTSHNTGKCLTKWVDPGSMLAISHSPTIGFLNDYTVFVGLGMKRERKES